MLKPLMTIRVTGCSLLLVGIGWLATRYRAHASPHSARGHSTLNEARMIAIIRASREAIITIDDSEIILMFNPMAEQLFGSSAADAIGTPLDRFIPDRFRAAHSDHVRQFGVAGISDRQMGKQRVLFGLKANGEEFPIEASISQIDDGGGKLYTVMLRDVTERVKADTTLQASREELRALSANLQHIREEEKTRIARELHDDLGQQLTALNMELADLAAKLPGATSKQQIQIARMHTIVDHTIEVVQKIAGELRLGQLDVLGLTAAIDWQVKDFSRRSAILCRVTRLDEIANLSEAQKTAVFRILQEALTNIVRHAVATEVEVGLQAGPDQVMLTVRDNGRGITSAELNDQTSIGLLGMRERAQNVGGDVAMTGGAGVGTAVVVRIPLP